MTEARLQHEIIMLYGQTWPEYRTLLFMVHNETENFKQRNYRKSMGQIPGVSDLILMVADIGVMAGIEVKAPGSTPKVEHVRRQFNWGKKVIENNGFYIMSSNLVQITKFITYLMNNDMKRAKEIQYDAFFFVNDQLKNKTIKF